MWTFYQKILTVTWNDIMFSVFIGWFLTIFQTRVQEEKHGEVSAMRQNELLNAKLRDVSVQWTDTSNVE